MSLLTLLLQRGCKSIDLSMRKGSTISYDGGMIVRKPSVVIIYLQYIIDYKVYRYCRKWGSKCLNICFGRLYIHVI